MQTKTIEYFDGQQKLVGELFGDKQQGSQPAVIIFHAFEGRGDFVLDYAKKIAEQGYVVFVADMYGNAATSDTLEGCLKLYTPLSQDRSLVRKRAMLAYETLLKQKNIDKNNIGGIGFCFGGLCLLETIRNGAHIKAAVTMHGILTKSDLATHPTKTKILALAGYQDPQVPPAQVQQFAQEMHAAGADDWTLIYFGDAKHSFTDPKTGTFDAVKEKEMGREYNPIAAKRSFQYAIDFFHEHLLTQ